MKSALVIVGALAAAGCKKGSDCEATIGNAFERAASKGLKELPELNRAEAAKLMASLRDAVIGRCKTDAWKAETISCVAEADKDATVRECALMLTREQSAELRTAAAAAWAASSGSNGIALVRDTPVGTVMDDTRIELREATRRLLAAGLPSNGQSTEVEDDLLRARERWMTSPNGNPLPIMRRAADLAMRYRIEVMMPGLILARPDAKAEQPLPPIGPSISFGNPRVADGEQMALMKMTVMDRNDDLLACYRELLRKEPGAAGNVHVVGSIGRDHLFGRATVAGMSSELHECFSRVLTGIEFPASVPANLTMTLTLRN